MEVLLSEKNPLLKRVRLAVRMGALTEDGFAIAEGPHLLAEAVASGREIGAVIYSESAKTRIQSPREIGAEVFSGSTKAGILNPPIRVVVVPDAIFSDLTATEAPQGVLSLVRPRVSTAEEVFAGRALVAVLDGIQDPGNAGAILRAAEAFGATGAVFLKGSVYPYNPKCVRGSAGSIFRLPVVAGLGDEELLSVIEKIGGALYAAMPRADVVVAGADFTKSCAIVIGSEAHGVRARLAETATGLRIPTSGVESLNAAVAAGILFYEARRQRNAS
jgi:RNA methyltransferase, TrmH family